MIIIYQLKINCYPHIVSTKKRLSLQMWIGLSWKNNVWTWEGGPRSSYLNWANGHPGDFTPIEGKSVFKLCVSMDTSSPKNFGRPYYSLVLQLLLVDF